MSQRILVVEDQEDNQQILRDLFTSADFEVIEAEDGQAGLVGAAVRGRAIHSGTTATLRGGARDSAFGG